VTRAARNVKLLAETPAVRRFARPAPLSIVLVGLTLTGKA
jgi:hypothetical protein